MISLNSKNIICATKEYSSKSQNKVPVAYNDLRICFIREGTACWQIDNKKHIVKKGDIILLNNRQKRYFTKFSDGFKIAIITLQRQAFLNTYHLSYLLNLIKENRYILNDEKLLSLLEELMGEYDAKSLNYYEMMSSKLTEFFVTAERKFGFDPKAKITMDKRMIKILDYIDSNIGRHITLKEVAKIANLTESSFSRMFSQYNGVTFKKYLMAKRVEYAILLLETTDLNIIHIAYECGFSSISGFYDAFKKITDTTPNKINNII